MHIRMYMQLIRDFLSKAITAAEFETRYLTAFKNEPGGMGREVFFILQDLFEDVDAYTDDWPPPPDLHYVISEDELRHEAQMALEALEQRCNADGTPSPG